MAMSAPQSALDEGGYRGVFDALPDAVLVADHAGRYLAANRAATDLLGYSEDEFRQLTTREIATLAPDVAVASHQLLIQEGCWVGTGTLRHKDGSLIAVEVRATEAVLPTMTVYLATFRRRCTDQSEAASAESAGRSGSNSAASTGSASNGGPSAGSG